MKNLPWIIVGIVALWVLSSLREPKAKGIDDVGFGKLPVLLNGRIQPIDSVAMNALRQIRGTRKVPLEGMNARGDWGDFQTIHQEGEGPLFERRWYQFTKHPKKLNATQWLLELMLAPDRADTRYVFALNHPDLIGELGISKSGLDRSGLRFFSFEDLAPHIEVIENHAIKIKDKASENRTPFERSVAKLRFSLGLFLRLKNSLQPQDTSDFADEIEDYLASMEPGVEAVRNQSAGDSFDQDAHNKLMRYLERYDRANRLAYPLMIAPNLKTDQREDWTSIGANLLNAMHTRRLSSSVRSFAEMSSAYTQENPERFAQALAKYRNLLSSDFSGELKKARIEYAYNHFAPFYKSIVLYLIAFLFACLSWFKLSVWMNRSAFYLIVIAVLIHTSGLLIRMFLEGRPPVTNLYSSALFVGWGAVLLGMILERFYKNGIGSGIASIVGFLTLLIAHNLSMSGDTMEMMRAVLDTNFWLATHVVVITLGYSATFVAGFLALIYVVRGLLTKTLDKTTARGLCRMVYGILCFATLFSFVGTILGGIWADQSWGRFWGWDPKENGALLIVLWNALVLHCRWGGFIKERGLMNLAIFGNVVTAFSWFGVNMLGIGLHSYGFMDAAFRWLAIFTLTQLGFIALGMLPIRFWQSFKLTSQNT